MAVRPPTKVVRFGSTVFRRLVPNSATFFACVNRWNRHIKKTQLAATRDERKRFGVGERETVGAAEPGESSCVTHPVTSAQPTIPPWSKCSGKVIP